MNKPIQISYFYVSCAELICWAYGSVERGQRNRQNAKGGCSDKFGRHGKYAATKVVHAIKVVHAGNVVDTGEVVAAGKVTTDCIGGGKIQHLKKAGSEQRRGKSASKI